MLDDDQQQKQLLAFDVATAVIKGTRAYQEDSLIASFPIGQTTGYAVVADGIGGHAAGDIASAIVATEVITHLKRKEAEIESLTQQAPSTLRKAAELANQRVLEYSAANAEAYGMGSTLLAPVVCDNKLWWLSIGDSPLLLFRDGILRQINKDHSMAPQIDMMVQMGSISPEVGKSHPDRNTLTSVVNGQKIPAIDCPETPINLLPDDIIVAASDGLQSLSNETIATTLMQAKNHHAASIVGTLLTEITLMRNEDQDNTSIMVLKVNARQPTSIRPENTPDLAAAPNKTEPKKTKTFFYRGREYTKED